MRVEAHVHIGFARKGRADCISTRDLPNGRVRYAGYLHLTDARFAVQPAGHRKAVESGVKNVHAFVRGTLSYESGGMAGTPKAGELLGLGYLEGGYNPRHHDTFIGANGEQLFRADHAILVGKRLFYK